MKSKRGISAVAFMATLSTAGRLPESAPKPEPTQPKTITVDRWDGQKWVELECTWDGERYV